MGGYSDINKYMRGEIVSLSPKQQGIMQSLQELMTSIEEPITLYRGMPESSFFNDDGNEVSVGDVVSMKSFTSTSRDPDIANNFAKGGHIYRI